MLAVRQETTNVAAEEKMFSLIHLLSSTSYLTLTPAKQ
jgi:hypothetical protein